MGTRTQLPKPQPVHARLVSTPGGGIVAEIGDGFGGHGTPIARATPELGQWRVRAMLGGHEEIVGSVAGATFALIEDLHEAFPFDLDRLEISVPSLSGLELSTRI